MSWLLPTPLLLVTGVVALWPLAAIIRRPTSNPRFFFEVLDVTLAVVALVQLAGTRRVIALWLVEQRW